MAKHSDTETASLLAAAAKAAESLRGKDFLCTWDHSQETLSGLVAAARLLERAYRAGRSTRCFDSGLAVSIFRDQSTRTRFAYASAANLLGLALADMDESKSQIAHGETVRETANMISFMAQAIGIRDDIFVHEGHKGMLEVADAVDEGFREGVLPQRPMLVNLQSDVDHPTQAMADLCHLAATFGGFEALRGKKLAMTWAYSPSYGKPLSVPQGIIGLMPRFGMHVTLAHPPGYDLLPSVLEEAHKGAKESGGSFEVVSSMEAAFADAHVVYPKSWAPLGLLEERTDALRKSDKPALDRLKAAFLENNAKFKSWECDNAKMAKTKNGDALYMHCLPADITGVSCAEGEVAANVFERYRIRTYREAAYKPFVIAAMIMLSRVADAADKLQSAAKGL